MIAEKVETTQMFITCRWINDYEQMESYSPIAKQVLTHGTTEEPQNIHGEVARPRRPVLYDPI